MIDIVKDQLWGGDYVKEEDPKYFVSEKTGRGPLGDDWLEEYWREVKGKKQPTSRNMSLMTAYKICRVEFRYWGMQTKLEKFIHDVALRKTMLRAHRQAWAWQDEWHGLTIEDIRELERQTQLALAKKMGGGEECSDGKQRPSMTLSSSRANISIIPSLRPTDSTSEPYMSSATAAPASGTSERKKSAPAVPPIVTQQPPSAEASSDEDDEDDDDEDEDGVGTNVELGAQTSGNQRSRSQSIQLANKAKFGSKGALHSPVGSAHSFDLQVSKAPSQLSTSIQLMLHSQSRATVHCPIQCIDSIVLSHLFLGSMPILDCMATDFCCPQNISFVYKHRPPNAKSAVEMLYIYIFS